MSPTIHHVSARRPWDSGTCAAEEKQREIAPRQEAAYVCARGHVFTVPFAAGAVFPATWDHKCGSPARLEGAPEDSKAPGKRERPEHDTSPMAQLRKRRSKKDGAEILAEALEHVRETGASR